MVILFWLTSFENLKLEDIFIFLMKCEDLELIKYMSNYISAIAKMRSSLGFFYIM